MTSFGLTAPPALSRTGVDRREPLRDDTARQAQLWPTARVLVVDRHGRTRVGGDPLRLVLVPAEAFGATAPEGAVLLGEQADIAYWGVRSDEETGAAESAGWREWQGPEDPDAVQWLDLRGVGALLDDVEAGLFTTAVSVLNWQRSARFCARCGSPIVLRRAGWASSCTQCQHEEYPRTDPAVICLVHDGGDQVLLARQAVWPAGRYSVLAGFVEAGESLEATVLREVAEEVGVLVRDVRYLGSQPWPFPRSLMLGFAAIADPSVPLVPADGEIEHAKWVPRQLVRAALAAGGQVDGLGLPGAASIAHQMLLDWVA